jgi:hypothetical protein
MSNITTNLIKAENKARDIAIKSHPDVFELVDRMMKLYIDGLNLARNSDNKGSSTDKVWLFLVTRSFHSIICSVQLMEKGYYAQAMTLVRMVIEAYFLCGNCKKNKSIMDALLYNKPNRPDRKTKFDYRALATRMGASDWYDNDYVFACQFSHTSHLSLDIMTASSNSSYRTLKLVPSYDELLFVACCKLLLRNGLLMTKFLGILLDDSSKQNVNTWHIKAETAVQQAQEWLDGLKGRY